MEPSDVPMDAASPAVNKCALSAKTFADVWASLANAHAALKVQRGVIARLQLRVLSLEEIVHDSAAFTNTSQTSPRSIDLGVSDDPASLAYVARNGATQAEDELHDSSAHDLPLVSVRGEM